MKNIAKVALLGIVGIARDRACSLFPRRPRPSRGPETIRAAALDALEPRCLLTGIDFNFQIDDGWQAEQVPGYYPDGGYLYGPRSNGLTYGWNIDHSDYSRDRNLNPDQLLDTIVQFKVGGVWELALADGTYDVTVSVGDAQFASDPTLNVEGASAWNAAHADANQFLTATVRVAVADGRLTLDQGTAGDKATRINYIDVVPVTPAAPPAPTGVEALSLAGPIVELDWADAPAPLPTGYSVYRSTDPLFEPGPATLIASGVTGTRYVDAVVTAGQTYYYRLTASAAAGTSAATAPVAVLVEASSLAVNFQPYDPVESPAVPGYAIDEGLTFADRGGGLSYGWNVNHSDYLRKRFYNADQRLDTEVLFHAGGRWEITLPNGVYSVTVSVGDAAVGSTNTVNVEGVNYWTARPQPYNAFSTKSAIVRVTDARLTIDSGASPDKASPINYVEMIPLGAGTLTATPITADRVRLDWSDLADWETGYRVERRKWDEASFATIATLPAGSTTFRDGALTPETQYVYRVTALGTARNAVPATASVYTSIAVEDLVGLWLFDEASGTSALDASDNANDGALFDGAARAAGHDGGAIEFNGTTSYVRVADDPALSPTAAITLSAWVNADDWSGHPRIVQKGAANDQYRLLAEDGVLKFEIATVGAVTAPLPTASAWHALHATYDGQWMKLYVDGLPVAAVPKYGAIPVTASPLYIGAKEPDAQAGRVFNGLIDGVAIYRVALSAGQIGELVGATPAAPAGPAQVRAEATEGGTVRLTWLDASTNEDYFIVEASDDGGATFSLVTYAGENEDGAEVGGLDSGSTYTFRVSAANAGGTSAPSAASAPVVIGGENLDTEGWYRVTTDGVLNHGDAGYIATGTLASLTAGWVYARSLADAARQALTGQVTVTNTGRTYHFGAAAPGWSDAAFKVLPSFIIGGVDQGPSVVLEDKTGLSDCDWDYNDDYFRISYEYKPAVWVVATDPVALEYQPANRATFTFYRTGPTYGTSLDVYYRVSGTADEGVDYGALDPDPDADGLHKITIQANQRSAAADVVAVTDAVTEGDETVIVTLAEAPYTGGGGGSPYLLAPAESAASLPGPARTRPTTAAAEIKEAHVTIDLVRPEKGDDPNDNDVQNMPRLQDGQARIGHWGSTGNAVPHNQEGLQGVKWKCLGLTGYLEDGKTLKQDFIGFDPDRFYVRVIDDAANKNEQVREKITVKLGTLKAGGAADDALHSITLEETGVNTGVFVSESQLLVNWDQADNSDDKYAAFSKHANANVEDEQADDRTHAVRLGGSVYVEYDSVAGKRADSATLEEAKTLNIRVHVFNEPGRDINNDGATNTILGAKDVARALVQAAIEDAALAWAQAGIRVQLVGDVLFEDAPIDPATQKSILDDEGWIGTNAEMAQIVRGQQDAKPGVVEVFYVPRIQVIHPVHGRQQVNGVTLMPCENRGAGDNTFVLIGLGADLKPLPVNARTLAHELGHAMENSPDVDVVLPNPRHVFYPANDTVPNTNVTTYRRITQDTEREVRRQRRPRRINDAGNLFFP